jgi:spore coat polysaccharide biosynthesis protein SpsF
LGGETIDCTWTTPAKKNMNARIITQCRMTSSRLPGKILMPLGQDTVLGHHLTRLKKTGWPVCIATTTNKADDPLMDLADRYEVDIVRGSENDVLDRFIKVFAKLPTEWFVRVTSDCPFIDPSLIQSGLQLLTPQDGHHTYISNCFPRSYARGFDFEIAHRSSLEEAAEQSDDPFDREHVTPYLWKNKNSKMVLKNLFDQQFDGSKYRVCIDTPEDYLLCQRLEDEFHASQMNHVGIQNTLAMHPHLVQINAHIEQKKS